ncbi:hypothetical protein FRC02_008268 [Tulasnella sp. 418]|nr:hypothetical protein FRC02_008268 [Tulasnella sp. 418]
MSLQVDNSTTVCSVEISTLIMLLPRLAIEAPRLLNEALPRLLVILKRVICWRVRPVGASKEPVTVGSLSDSGSNIQIDANSAFQLELLPDVKWTRLESSFDLTRSSPPDARLYFQFLYGLWPCNTLAFLRRPIKYLKDAGQEGPFADSWEEIIDEDEVHSRAKPILRSHILHPSIILRDSASELSDLSRWATDGLNVPGIFSECIILDVRNAAAAMPRSTAHAEFASSPIPGQLEDILGLKAGFPVQQLDSPSSSRAASKTRDETEAQIDQNWSSARDMAVPTVDLQYPMMDVVSSPPQLADDTPRDSRDLFTPRARGGNDSASPSIPPTPASPNLRASSPLTLPSPLPLTPSLEAHPSPRLHSRLLVSEALKHAKAREASEISAQAQEVISTLQREVLLLRNELNFELSLKHNHLTHMGKLHRDRVIARSEEAERQNLHNKLKHHKGALSQALEELKTVKAQATAAKFKQNEYISILSDRLAKYREEKQSWLNEAVELRGELNEAKLMVQKQKSILDDTETERFHLANQLRDVLPKVEQINDYEKKILSMTKIQIMWDDSPEMREYRQKKEEMDIMTSNYAKMELTLESLEAANRALEEEIAKQRRTIQSLQNNPSSSPTSSNNSSPTQSHFHYGSRMNRSMSVSVSQSQAQAMNVSHARLLTMETEHERVKRENIELEEKVEELEAMLEVLKMESASRAPGRRGSVHLSGFSLDPRDMRAGGLGMC